MASNDLSTHYPHPRRSQTSLNHSKTPSARGKTARGFQNDSLKGDFFLVLVLPDGSKTMIPEHWTDFHSDRHKKAAATSTDSEKEGNISDSTELLHLRRIVDSLIEKIGPARQLYASDRKEAKHATRISHYGSRPSRNKPLASNRKTNTKSSHRKSGRSRRKSGKKSTPAERRCR